MSIERRRRAKRIWPPAMACVPGVPSVPLIAVVLLVMTVPLGAVMQPQEESSALASLVLTDPTLRPAIELVPMLTAAATNLPGDPVVQLARLRLTTRTPGDARAVDRLRRLLDHDQRYLSLDRLIHGYVDLADPTWLGYDYERLYAAVIGRLWPSGRARSWPVPRLGSRASISPTISGSASRRRRPRWSGDRSPEWSRSCARLKTRMRSLPWRRRLR